MELILLFIGLLKIVVADDKVWGCGGNLISEANIDYSKVNIKLLKEGSKAGTEVDCSPSGYYFLPLESKGKYILRVDPPGGWSFGPTEHIINVDGLTDDCSLDKQLNFIFKGFGITGKVASRCSNDEKKDIKNSPTCGSSSESNNDKVDNACSNNNVKKEKNNCGGPSGVTVSLYNNDLVDLKNLVGETTTTKDGIFSFTPIEPGKYILVASHPTWKFEKDNVKVTVQEGNTELIEGSLIVFGYDVSGEVLNSDNQGMADVSLILSGNGKFKDCLTTPIDTKNNTEILCHIKTDKNGKFIFPALTNGEYQLTPHYPTTQALFEPLELSFKVEDKSVILPKSFKLKSFTVSGKVFMSNNDQQTPVPLADAKVFLSGKHVATTDKNGDYILNKMSIGEYTLEIKAENLKFVKKIVKISASSPILPTFYASSYNICGSVTHSAGGTFHHRKIIVENSMTKTKNEIDVNPKTGQYCIYLAPGKYQFNVIVSAEEKNKGLQFFPLQHEINVIGEPLKNINFLQLKATLTGTIECLKQSTSDCNRISVTLKVLGGITIKTINAIDGKYEFTEILPGNYEVLVDTDIFCWENPSHKISVTSERAIIPIFKQTGFSVTFVSSHDSAVEFFDSVKSKKVALTLPVGSTRHCVSSPGEYKFIPQGCHVYPHESYIWNTNNQSPIILSSIEHRHRGKIIVPIRKSSIPDEKKYNIHVKVEIENTDDNTATTDDNRKNKKLQTSITKTNDDGIYRFTYEFNGNSDNTYIITPLSDFILFNPPSIKVIGTNDCNDDIATFSGHVGMIVNGKIQPPMEDVTIQIFGNDKEVPVHTLITEKNGLYNVGPLDGNVNYSVTAEKPGYTINGPDDNGIFFAHKLAEIIVDVVDKADNLPLQNVLLSLSGSDRGGYRKNSMTGQQGQIIFNGLSPGEYYLRPMMKEYKFDPQSKIIKVTEGATLKIKLLGKRVSFSAYGSIKSLNGEAESGVIVEALGQASDCLNFQEEAVTEDNGKFRIRGLEPSCTYIVQLKPEVQPNSHIHRASPTSIDIKITNNDIHGLEFISFHPISRTDLSAHIITNQPEYYKTLKIKLCREDQPDTPIHTSNIDPQSVQSAKFNNQYNPGFLIHLPPLRSNGKKYFLLLESSLSSSLYKYKTLPIYFEANSSFKAIQLQFYAERKIDQAEMSQSSMIALPLIIIIAIAFFNRDKLLNWLSVKLEEWMKTVPVSRTPIQPSAPVDPRADDIIVEQIMNINKRKTKPRKT